MAKYDEQLSRMSYLMEYKQPKKEVASNIEYHANGADGKVYGILKEGTKYYIKTTEQGKENISESYDYINGFNNRRENEFKSYNDATKHLELKLMSLNEAYGKHEDVSTVDFKRGEKVLNNLTEEARRELDRMNQILENSMNIGRNNIGNPESKGSASPENTTKNNDPFTEKASASLDKDPKTTGTVEKATPDNKKVSNVEKDLQSDKNKTANSGSEKDYKDAHDDLDGEGVADKKPAGGKVVRVNEGFECETDDYVPGDEDLELNDFEGGDDVDTIDAIDTPEDSDEGLDTVDNADAGLGSDEVIDTPDTDIEATVNDMNPEDGEPVGLGAEEDEFDSLLEELENATKSTIVGPDKTMDGPHGNLDVQTWDKMNKVNENDVEGPDEDVMKNEKNSEKKLPVQTWDRMDETISLLVKDVYKKLMNESKEAKLKNKINKMVKEEITRLDAWGKHPKYRKEPMTTPANKEVLAGTADRDFNDDSTKGEQPYGQKIGNGAPFEKIVNILTDQVMSQLKESLRK